jgi:hypothetical protein
MTASGETERVSERSFIVEEVTPEEALMSCHMAMRDPLEDDAELTVMWKVLAAFEEQRFVKHRDILY